MSYQDVYQLLPLFFLLSQKWQITHGQRDGMLASGIDESWTAAMHGNCKLLVAEKDYVFVPVSEFQEKIPTNTINYLSQPFYIKYKVDAIDEKILESGAAIDIAGNDLLRSPGHIAVVKYS